MRSTVKEHLRCMLAMAYPDCWVFLGVAGILWRTVLQIRMVQRWPMQTWKKLFALILKGATSSTNIKGGRDSGKEAMFLKPLTSPGIEGGNVVVE